MTFSPHVCVHIQSKTTPSCSKWVQIYSPALHLTMNILLGDKWGFALQVMVDAIHCHHTGLVNTTNITVQPGCLYVPDLQLPPRCPPTPPSRRPKQQVTNTVWTTQVHLQKNKTNKLKNNNNCKITLSSEWNWERTIQSGLNGVSERNRWQGLGGFVEPRWFRHGTRIKNVKTPHLSPLILPFTSNPITLPVWQCKCFQMRTCVCVCQHLHT